MPWKVTEAFNPGVSVVHTSFPGPQPGRRRSAESGRRGTSRAPLRSPVGRCRLIDAGHQSPQWDNFGAGFLIEAHDGRVSSVEVSEHADPAAKADALAHSKWAFRTTAQGVHLVGSGASPHLGRGIRRADPFGRRYGIGTETVVGVVTVRPIGVVTVAETIGVLTVTVAATVTGDDGVGSVGRETVGTRSVEGSTDATTSAVEERIDAGFASPVEPGVDAEDTLSVEPSAVFD
jgi:hypothetical protein